MSEIGYAKWRRDFKAEHGEYVPMSGYWLLFEDGTRLARGPENLHWEAAPTDKVEKLRLLAKFWEAKQRLARLRFRELKTQLEVTFLGRRVGFDEIVEHYRGTEEEGLSALRNAQQEVRRADNFKHNVENQLRVAIDGPDWQE